MTSSAMISWWNRADRERVELMAERLQRAYRSSAQTMGQWTPAPWENANQGERMVWIRVAEEALSDD